MGESKDMVEGKVNVFDKDDGIWIEFRTKNGSSYMINMHPFAPGIKKGIFLEWFKEQKEGKQND